MPFDMLGAWLADLQRGEHADALEPTRLSAALRALLVRAISRGSVRAAGHPDHGGPVLLLAAEDVAVLEIVREIAATLDDTTGTAIVADFDAYREDTLDRIFAMTARDDCAQRSATGGVAPRLGSRFAVVQGEVCPTAGEGVQSRCARA